MELVTLYDHRNQSKKYNWSREEELSDKIIEQKEYIKKLLIRGANPSIENTYKFNCFNASRNLPDDQQQEINNFINKILKLESPKSNKSNDEIKNDKWWKFW